MNNREKNIACWRQILAQKPPVNLPGDPLFFLKKEPVVDISDQFLVTESKFRPVRAMLAIAATLLLTYTGTLFFRYFYAQQTSIADQKTLVMQTHGVNQAFGVHGRVPRVLQSGDFLDLAEVVITGPGSHLDLKLPGGILVRVGPASRYRVQLDGNREALQVRSHLDEGKLYSIIDHKLDSRPMYDVVTPTAIARVRGTSFKVSTDGKETKMYLLSGKVEVQPRGASADSGAESKILEHAGDFVHVQENRIVVKSVSVEAVDADALEFGQLMDAGELQKAFTLSKDPEIRRQHIAQSQETRVIKMRNGQKIKGIVVFQKNGKMYVETAEKSVIIASEDVDSIVY